jgi:hypothetical protein
MTLPPGNSIERTTVAMMVAEGSVKVPSLSGKTSSSNLDNSNINYDSNDNNNNNNNHNYNNHSVNSGNSDVENMNEASSPNTFPKIPENSWVLTIDNPTYGITPNDILLRKLPKPAFTAEDPDIRLDESVSKKRENQMKYFQSKIVKNDFPR